MLAVTPFNAQCPLLLIVTLCAVCVEYPTVAARKVIEGVLDDQIIGGEVTVKDSGISLWAGFPFVVDIRRVPVYVPGDKPVTGRICTSEDALACTVIDGLWVI